MESPPPANNNQLVTDLVLPFMLESSGIRGRFVRLGLELDTILRGHRYPQVVSQLLGELLILAGMMGSMLKLKGLLTIQVQGDGAVSLLTADYHSKGHLRGYARMRHRDSLDSKSDVQQEMLGLFGKGHIIITIETENEQRPYQAIVALEGNTLSECLTNYFKQSEQLEAMIVVAVSKSKKYWCAGGVLLQRVPKDGGKPGSKGGFIDKELAWETANILLSSVKDQELFDEELSPHDLLYRLFHQEGVRVFDPYQLEARCRCSREKIINVLKTLSPKELDDMKIGDEIQVTCDFCKKVEIFKEGDL